MDHSKTLREQGIDESETVLLRRKYFFSDGNVDSRDPVQLNLLFVQARDSILNGTHPVTLDKACEFAGIQCQAQFGDYVESKHKPGFLEFSIARCLFVFLTTLMMKLWKRANKLVSFPLSISFFFRFLHFLSFFLPPSLTQSLTPSLWLFHLSIGHSRLVPYSLKEFLPQSYVKIKGVEKKTFGEHKKHNSLSEIEAKVAYVKTARSLSTYGVTFFLVKVKKWDCFDWIVTFLNQWWISSLQEKMKGKNKLAPRLLGVTKDSVLRLDERTKEILKVWPLTTVRRWAASPNTFTLDFGDYSDQYYSVQTTEGEQISQLIAGYIDIILKKVIVIDR